MDPPPPSSQPAPLSSAAAPPGVAYSSIPPPPPAAAWRCDGCGRQNGRSRYMCQQCRGYNTYDLCEQCIGRVNVLHPSHTFQLVSQSPW